MSYREFWITQHALRFISVTWSPRNRPWDIVNYGWFWIISLENQSRWLITVICEFDLSGQPRSDEEKKRYERLTDSNKKFGVNLTFIFWGFKYKNNELKSNKLYEFVLQQPSYLSKNLSKPQNGVLPVIQDHVH